MRPDLGLRFTDALRAAFAECARGLGELDRQAGDGDFGTNITTALERVAHEVETAGPSSYRDWMTSVSRGFLGTGGTSGPLFGMYFRDLAHCVEAGNPTVVDLAAGLTSGVATVQRYGKAKVGDKTMVDAFAPAALALTEEASIGADATAALSAAAEAAVRGAQSTSDLLARRGRASYIGEAARGVLDPGAAAAALMIQALAAAASDLPQPRVDSSWIDA